MSIKRTLNKISYSLKHLGFKATTRKVIDKLLNKKEEADEINKVNYVAWQENNNLTEEDIKALREEKFEYNPKISIVVPLYNTKKEYFEELIDYVRMQTYINWELCLVDASDTKNYYFKKIIKVDGRIRYKELLENKGIAENTNEAINMVLGDYVLFLDHDDLLEINCLSEIVRVLNKDRSIDLIYSDEDKILNDKVRVEPHFKPDFSLETLECTNYITHLVCAKKDLIDKVGKLKSEFDGAQDYDFVLRLSRVAKNVCHIPKVLYHWRMAKGSTANFAEEKPYAYEAGVKVLNKYFKDFYSSKMEAQMGSEVPGVYKINYRVDGNPRVNIIIPNKDNIKILDRCITSIINLSTYSNYKIVVVENNSTDKDTFDYYKSIEEKYKDRVQVVYYEEKEFNYSKIINYGVNNSEDCDYILQLNNDTKLLTPDFLEQMIGMYQKGGIGAIGARLYYEDYTIQHAGIAYGIKGTAGNLFVNLPKGRHAYLGMEAMIRNVSAVTGACLFTSKEMYEEVGFMDESLAVAFNDVDFCLKIREKGLRIVYNPFIEFIHYESKSRGYEDTAEKKERFEKETNLFKSKWKDLLENTYDPYFNKNFSREFAEFIIRKDRVE